MVEPVRRVQTDYPSKLRIGSGEQPTAYGSLVKTRIVKGDGEPVTLNYLMVNGISRPQIGDVY